MAILRFGVTLHAASWAGAKNEMVAGLSNAPALKMVRWPWRLQQKSGLKVLKTSLNTILSGCVSSWASLFRSMSLVLTLVYLSAPSGCISYRKNVLKTGGHYQTIKHSIHRRGPWLWWIRYRAFETTSIFFFCHLQFSGHISERQVQIDRWSPPEGLFLIFSIMEICVYW